MKRWSKTKAFPNYWSFVGWRLEEWESLEEAVTREVKEESNLIFKPTKLFYFSENNGFKLNRFLWEWRWEIKIQEEELNGYWWFTYNEAVKQEIAFDNLKVLELLKEKKLID